MRWEDAASLALAVGVGGAVGAALTASVAGSRLAKAFHDFSEVFKPYVASRTDAATLSLADAFAALEAQVEAFEASLARLRRSLKSKSR